MSAEKKKKTKAKALSTTWLQKLMRADEALGPARFDAIARDVLLRATPAERAIFLANIEGLRRAFAALAQNGKRR